MYYMRNILFILVVCLLSLQGTLNATITDPPIDNCETQDTLPKVFVLGDHEDGFEQLTLDHQMLLLTACNDDMDEAFDKWWSMISEMEAYADLIGYDLKGMKIWLNVFWEKDGSVSHIAYHLKPNSKNMQLEDLESFFENFINNYKFPLLTSAKFSHYGSASFPTLPRRLKKTKLPNDNQTFIDSVGKTGSKKGKD